MPRPGRASPERANAVPRLLRVHGRARYGGARDLCQQHVTAQIAALAECLDLITFKIGLYEACLAQGSADPLFTSPVPAHS
jgi:hypothetical protein